MLDPDHHTPFPSSPVIAGIALLGTAVLLRNWQPGALDLPEADSDRPHRDRGARRAARKARDGIAAIMPRNLTRSVARSLMIVGASLILMRALDELVEDEESLF
ncbi:hypothetical protein ABMC89_14510 [Sulfitobacter sp. HNIBRBA3233]|uniref:hypothetical protein n=1 Tax=Sulfitobacter marinivivus TaxID=3158558 RepID=UPI0032DF4006